MNPPVPLETPVVERLLEVVDPTRDIAVRIHTSPDPDALGAGAGLSVLLSSRVGYPVPVLYEGDLERVDTEAMARDLCLNLRQAGRDEDPPQLVYTDCQPGSSNVCAPGGLVVGIVDHHPWNGRCEAPFLDIRPGLGAASTLVALYLQESKIDVPPRVAAALLYGIRTDSRHLCSLASTPDVDAFAWLHARADREALGWIERNTIRLAQLPVFRQAFEDLVLAGETAFVRLRNVERFTWVPHVAELLLAVAEISFVAAWTVQGDHLRISIRHERTDLDAPDALAAALGPAARVGGHPTAAAGWVPIPQFAAMAGVAAEDGPALDEAMRTRLLAVVGVR